ncbi:serine/threonine-protein kinase [Pseudomonas sp. GZJR-8]|uniref:serine/threonine protein kinase n=1 Tax=Pseudomonas sp. GZJR-8 TaxID=1395925 RepID=UPI000CDA70DB|nr:serine/threonine-protein kinase [Pseudomonas sp. GZJR-8]
MLQLPERYKSLGDVVLGGMGEVVFCQDTILERCVAIKVLQGDIDQRRIFDELSALMRVRSKHVVQVYDYLQFHGRGLGIVQEFVEGRDLLEVDFSGLTIYDYYKNIWQVASGIADIHSVGVIHRDIKPNNIKVDPEGVLKIFDFGLARNDCDASTMGFIGTHGFAAPELYSATVDFTNAIDVYSFAATALHMAIGGLPAQMMKPYQVSGAVDYFCTTRFPIPAILAGLLNSCLHSDPAQRPSILMVRDELQKHILHDAHQALVVYKGQAKYLGSGSRSINLKVANIGDVDICYDGLSFSVTRISGEVFINNEAVNVGYVLPGSCVVALGGGWRKNVERTFVTFDLSHPEIVL